jgi:hypothetical protein
MALRRQLSPQQAAETGRHNASGLVNHWTTICLN